MRLCPVRLALRPIRNAVAQRASPSSMIRRRPDPVPPDQINTSPDLILPVSLQLLGGKKKISSGWNISVSSGTQPHYSPVKGQWEALSPSSYNCHCTVITIYIKYLLLSFLVIYHGHLSSIRSRLWSLERRMNKTKAGLLVVITSDNKEMVAGQTERI